MFSNPAPSNGLLTIDTTGGNAFQAQNTSGVNGLDLNDLRTNKTKYLDANTNSLLRKMY